MNEDIFSGKWHQFKGKIKEKWGKLTDDDLTKINGKREHLLGSLQERYGWERHQAEEELKRFEQHCRECCSKEGKDHSSCCGKEKIHFKDHKGCCDKGNEDRPKNRKIS